MGVEEKELVLNTKVYYGTITRQERDDNLKLQEIKNKQKFLQFSFYVYIMLILHIIEKSI